MKKNKILAGLVLIFVITFSADFVGAQSAYFQAITNLNPVGYWPMHEMEAAAPGDIETNYGTLGVLGTGFYPDWATGPGIAIQHQINGALVGDTDAAVYFGSYNGSGPYTNELFIPHTTPLSTLNPPFSVECWFYTTNATAGNDVWSQNGFQSLNGGPIAGNTGKVGGIRLFGAGTGFTLYTFDPGQNNLMSCAGLVPNKWFHVMVTCDASTNFSLYTNGVLVKTVSAVGKYTPDYWTPFEVGNGRGNTRAMDCGVDELAIYTNVISDIAQHYSDGTNSAPVTSYYQDVINDNPVIYLRMDSPTYVVPSITIWPALTNYGSVTTNGVYTPGTVPGSVTGPVNPSNLAFTGVSGNVPQLSGVSSYGDAGYANVYNPTGAVPFTVAAMFRGNPNDNRINGIVGHSDNSWHLFLDTSGKLECGLGTDLGSAIISSKVYNDGNWHQLIEVYTPAASPNVTGTNALYVDGVLDTVVNTVSTNGIGPGTNLDVIIGSDPQYTNNPAGVGRQFAGQVCEVALFTNALNMTQVLALYNAAGEILPPAIISQPLASKSGGTIVFKVTANGTAPLAYQWYFSITTNYSDGIIETDGNGVSGSTTSSLIVTNLADFYFVVVTNNYGSVTSAVASVAGSLPIITTQIPLTYTNPFILYPGFDHTFSISAVGAQPIFYQWYTNGVRVGGATNTSLTLTNVLSSFTNYCITTNVFGATTSYWAAVIIPIPTAPYPQVVIGLKPVDYWRLNEPDNGGNNAGVVCHDYIRGNNGLYTNVNLGEPTYNPTLDPAETSMLVGNISLTDNDVDWIGTNVDFAKASGNAEFSIGAWVALYANGGGGIVAKGYGGSEEACIDTGNGTAHAFRFFVRNAAGTAVNANSTNVPNLDLSWNYVVGVCDEANGKVFIYVNGALAGSATITAGSGILNDTAWPLTIGSRASTPTSGNTIQSFGYIDDVAIFNYALSSDQVATLYQTGITTNSAYTSSTNLMFSLTGNQLTLLWPADHIGWQLQSQTNSLNIGISTNWFNVANSTVTNQITIPLNSTNGSVFYRMILP